MTTFTLSLVDQHTSTKLSMNPDPEDELPVWSTVSLLRVS